MDAPIIFVVSCSDFDPNDLVLDIIGQNCESSVSKIENGFSTYPWSIDNKYYSATVNIIALRDRYDCIYNDPSKLAFLNSIIPSLDALIFYFDADKVESFNEAKCWLKVLGDGKSTVNLLVCNSCPIKDASARENIWSWCLDSGFELVELFPAVEEDEDDDFKDTYGVPRIIQALHAHTWPNLLMKDKVDGLHHLLSVVNCHDDKMFAALSANLVDSLNEFDSCDEGQSAGDNTCASQACREAMPASIICPSVQEANITKSSEESCSVSNDQSTSDGISNKSNHAATSDVLKNILPSEEAELLAALGEGDDDESFEKLFSKLSLMKDHASKLTGADRRQYAEQVVMSFWKAIGGDADEIAGLDSDCD